MVDPSTSGSLHREQILFVTGRLAEKQVRRIAEMTSRSVGFGYAVQVMGISVAALMHARWLERKLTAGDLTGFDRVIVPGWCQGDLHRLTERFGVPFEAGPKDIQDLPAHFGHQRRQAPPMNSGSYDTELLAEINHAPRLAMDDIVAIARRFHDSGADVIDLGCIPGECWSGVGEAVRRLRSEGLRVSIDSFDRREVEAAVEAGAELVLSCNSTNAKWAAQLPVEWVAVPDEPRQWMTLWPTVAQLHAAGRTVRIDPILEPVGYGFAESLFRFYAVRQNAGDLPLMMGIGNVTELSEVDSAGINFLLAAICQELRIGSVLTTEVIHWCCTAVAEFDRARRLVKFALDQHTLPKHVDSGLVMLRDGAPLEMGDQALVDLARSLTDANYRIFVERGEIHVMNRDGYWRGRDPFELFEQFSAVGRALDPAHAFYLGYELSKAVTALTLGKRYVQDEALRWGFLTVPERSTHEKRRTSHRHSP